MREIEDFYRHVPYYMYNLVIWHASGQRLDYVDHALAHLRRHKSQAICDFGCGVGTDGLQLLEAGFDVVFCDYDSPSMQFLRWRLNRRGLSAKFIEPGAPLGDVQFDTLWAMDVLEHLPDPRQSLTPFLRLARVYCCTTEHDGCSHGRHPFHFQHDDAALQAMYRNMGFRRDTSLDQLHLWYRLP